MSDSKIDIVTVAFWDEIRLLQLQAKSIVMFLDTKLLSSIYVVVNDPSFNLFSKTFKDIVLPEYGPLSDKVILVDAQDICSRQTSMHLMKGWIKQQILKLYVASIVQEEHYLVLDCKNHFIKPISHKNFFSKSGLPKINTSKVTNYHQHFSNSLSYFGINSRDYTDKSFPTITPYLIVTRIASDLIYEVERREKKPFSTIFLEKGPFTEFYLYFGFLLSKHNNSFTAYSKQPRSMITLFTGTANKPTKGTLELLKTNNPNIFCLGIHRNVLINGNRTLLTAIEKAWLEIGLIQSKEQFLYFRTIPKKTSIFRIIYAIKSLFNL